MSNIVSITNGETVTTTSAIALGTDNEHASVILLVRKYQSDMEDFGGVRFEIEPFETAGGTQQREVAILNEQQSTLLLTYMRNSDIVRAFKKRLVKEFWEMAQKLRQGPGIPQSLPEALRLAADLAERNETLAIERDEAIRTKAQIGSRREATAMSNVAKARRESAQLRDELGRNSRHATIIAVEKALNTKFPRNAYVALRRWCRERGVSPTEVVDDRYGMVKAWPAGAWMDCEGVDLEILFASGDLTVLASAQAVRYIGAGA